MPIDENRLRTLVSIFLAENKKLNLSAFRTEEHCWIGNVLDSIALLKAFRALGFHFESTLIDIGTGGGFPLLPLAICLPETQCIGIDATAKKIDAVSRIVASLGLTNVQLIFGRCEELAHRKELRSSADLVMARAIAPIRVLLEYAVPLLKVGGLCAFWKSTKVADELGSSANAQKLLHASFVGTYEYELPGSFLAGRSPARPAGGLGGGWGRRLIVLFRKTAATSEEYPRKVGVPKAKPL